MSVQHAKDLDQALLFFPGYKQRAGLKAEQLVLLMVDVSTVVDQFT